VTATLAMARAYIEDQDWTAELGGSGAFAGGLRACVAHHCDLCFPT
jgi:hypothetical protein